MILNDSSNVIHFKYGNNSSELKEILAEDFYPDISDIVIIDGEYYHAKMVTNREMLNELIGSYYSRLVGLDAVDYKIGILNGQIYALSKMFFPHAFFHTQQQTQAVHYDTTSQVLPVRFFFQLFCLYVIL